MLKLLTLNPCYMSPGETTKMVNPQPNDWSTQVQIDPIYLLARMFRESTDTFIVINVEAVAPNSTYETLDSRNHSTLVLERVLKDYDLEKAVVYRSPKLIENPAHPGHPRLRFVVLKGLGEKNEV